MGLQDILKQINVLRDIKGLGQDIGQIYTSLSSGKSKFTENLLQKVQNAKHDGRTLNELAEQYGVKEEFNNYVKNMPEDIRTKLASTYNSVHSLYRHIEHIIEGADAVYSAATAPETGGASEIPAVETQLLLYGVLGGVYDGLAWLLGKASGTYTEGIKGSTRYLSDRVASDARIVSMLVPGLGTILSFTTNFGDPTKNIELAAQERATYKLVQLIKEKNPEANIKPFAIEPDLGETVQRNLDLYDRAKERVKDFGGGLIDYVHSAADKIKPYFNDMSQQHDYQTINNPSPA